MGVSVQTFPDSICPLPGAIQILRHGSWLGGVNSLVFLGATFAGLICGALELLSVPDCLQWSLCEASLFVSLRSSATCTRGVPLAPLSLLRESRFASGRSCFRSRPFPLQFLVISGCFSSVTSVACAVRSERLGTQTCTFPVFSWVS